MSKAAFGAVLEKYIETIPKEVLQNHTLAMFTQNADLRTSLAHEVKKAITSKIEDVESRFGYDEKFSQFVTNTQLEILSTPPIDFQKFPLEIRRMIWKILMPKSRILKCALYSTYPRLRRAHAIISPDHQQFRSTTQLPITLSINQESRAETLRRFKLSFAPSGYQGHIYVDYENDIICFGPRQNSEKDEKHLAIFERTFKNSVFRHNLMLCQIEQIQQMTCSYDQFLAIISKFEFVQKFVALRKVFVDVECQYRKFKRREDMKATYLRNDIYKEEAWVHGNEGCPWGDSRGGLDWMNGWKVKQMSKPFWQDEVDPDHSSKKLFYERIIRAVSIVNSMIPSWNPPIIHFGVILRLELNEQVVELKEELAEIENECI